MTSRTILIASIVALAGCVSMGREITEDQLAGFKKGETTIEEVVNALGRPTSSSVSSSGTRYLSYIYARSQPRPGSFVPIVGPLIGGSDSRTSHAFFTFDANGRLRDYRLSTSGMGMGTGFNSGPYEPQIPGQPMPALP